MAIVQEVSTLGFCSFLRNIKMLLSKKDKVLVKRKLFPIFEYENTKESLKILNQKYDILIKLVINDKKRCNTALSLHFHFF